MHRENEIRAAAHAARQESGPWGWDSSSRVGGRQVPKRG